MATQRTNVNLGCVFRGLVPKKREVTVLFSRTLRERERAVSHVEWLRDQ